MLLAIAYLSLGVALGAYVVAEVHVAMDGTGEWMVKASTWMVVLSCVAICMLSTPIPAP